MSKSHIGARVLYCGHNGYFIADIYEIAGANVVRANGPVNGQMLTRDGVKEDATHHVKDFPYAGFWRPDLGVFVVPSEQVTELRRIKRVTRKRLLTKKQATKYKAMCALEEHGKS